MACYADRDVAEKCARVINYVRPFGKDSEVKLVGIANSGGKKCFTFQLSLTICM